MSTLMIYDEGPKTKVYLTKTRSSVACKINEQNSKDLLAYTMQRVVSARREIKRDRNTDVYGSQLKL